MKQQGMNISQKEANLLNEFKEKVWDAFPQRINSIALFGSRATGRAKRDSDYDAFIMAEKFF